MEQNKIRIEGIRWSSYDQRTWLGTTPYMVYTIEPKRIRERRKKSTDNTLHGLHDRARGAWLGTRRRRGKEILPSLVEAKQRALEDHVSRVNQALRIKRWKYEERIGGV